MLHRGHGGAGPELVSVQVGQSGWPPQLAGPHRAPHPAGPGGGRRNQ